MTGCEAVRETLVDVARGAPNESSLRAHLELCPDCRRRLANERMLSAGLAAIASPGVPPTAVRDAVMAEFRRANKVVPIRRPIVKWIAIAAAAVLVLAVLLASKHRPEKVATTVPPQVIAPVPVPEKPAVKAPAVVANVAKTPAPAKRVSTSGTVKPRRRTVQVQHPPADDAPEVATDFFEIPYSEPIRPEERVDVFRMQVPRANMAAFGLPVMGGRLDSRVTADVLVGEDGVMRAIRFIR